MKFVFIVLRKQYYTYSYPIVLMISTNVIKRERDLRSEKLISSSLKISSDNQDLANDRDLASSILINITLLEADSRHSNEHIRILELWKTKCDSCQTKNKKKEIDSKLPNVNCVSNIVKKSVYCI